jgi:hypothetical protein
MEQSFAEKNFSARGYQWTIPNAGISKFITYPRQEYIAPISDSEHGPDANIF